MKRESMSDRLVGIIGARIAAGDLAGIVTTDTLMAQYAVSRTTMREALARLATKGMAQACPGEGVRIAGSEAWDLADADVLRWLLPISPGLAAEADELAELLDGQQGPLARALLDLIGAR